jgi:hypothetical protein
MNFDIAKLFVGISKVQIDNLEVPQCEDFYLVPETYQIHCLFTKYEKPEELTYPLNTLNRQLVEASSLTKADLVTFTFVDQSNIKYDFVFKDVSLKFNHPPNRQNFLLTIDFNPTKFEIKRYD